MKSELQTLITQAFAALRQKEALVVDAELPPLNWEECIHIERTRDKQHGDFATNVALTLAKSMGKKPRELAELIKANIPASTLIERIEIAGPGFINFYLASDAKFRIVTRILQKGDQFGQSLQGAGEKIHIEFVSANPNGPLHVGHGRGAAYGSVVANLLSAIGYDVHREYYVNDAGRQMHILTVSIWLRYLEQIGETFSFPSNGYQGDYVVDLAKRLYQEVANTYHHPAKAVFHHVRDDLRDGHGDADAHVDDLIKNAKSLLGATAYQHVFKLGLDTMQSDIRSDLAEFGVHYQTWFSEQSLTDTGALNRALTKLQDAGHLYKQDGATWFRATHFGDDKDRVVVRENGEVTYFAADVAYHLNKLERGFTKIIDVLGADHHGYVPRLRAVLAALGADAACLQTPLVQFAILYRGKERVQMSTRSGSFVTLRELRHEVGNDAARFFYVMRKADQHLDFDLELAKSQSQENPVYYIQYAHARICSVFRQNQERGYSLPGSIDSNDLALLESGYEHDLVEKLAQFEEVLHNAAKQLEPHVLCHYLRELAHSLHTYYNAVPFIVEDARVRNARLNLILATRYVLANGLRHLGITAPESM